MNELYKMLTETDDVLNKVALIGDIFELAKVQLIENQKAILELREPLQIVQSTENDEPDDFIHKNINLLDLLNKSISLSQAVDNIYAEGGQIDRLYERYLRTLPKNLRNEDPDFNMYRYWELNGKPKNFKLARERGMFTWNNEDKSYHAGSVAYDLANDRYEFVKSPNHHSVDMELLQYFNSDEMSNFRRDWKLNMDHNPYLYERRKLGDTSLFANGGPVNIYGLGSDLITLPLRGARRLGNIIFGLKKNQATQQRPILPRPTGNLTYNPNSLESNNIRVTVLPDKIKSKPTSRSSNNVKRKQVKHKPTKNNKLIQSTPPLIKQDIAQDALNSAAQSMTYGANFANAINKELLKNAHNKLREYEINEINTKPNLLDISNTDYYLPWFNGPLVDRAVKDMVESPNALLDNTTRDILYNALNALRFGLSYLSSDGYQLRLSRMKDSMDRQYNGTISMLRDVISEREGAYSPYFIRKLQIEPSLYQNAYYSPKTNIINVGISRFPFVTNTDELRRGLTEEINKNRDKLNSYNLDNYVKDYYNKNKAGLYGYDNIIAHEFGHGLSHGTLIFNNLDGSDDPDEVMPTIGYNAPYSSLIPLLRESKSYQNMISKYPEANLFSIPSKYYNMGYHDSYPDESYGDLLELRYDLNKFNVFDSRLPNIQFTKPMLNYYKTMKKMKGEPMLPRIFGNFSEDLIIDMINNVAQNNNSGNNNNINQYDLI